MSATFWASYTSGALGILVGNRLDVLKVQAQAGLSLSRPSPSATAATTATTPILPTSTPPPPPPTAPTATSSTSPTPRASNLRALSAPFRGAAAPILGYGALNSILFLTFNRTLSILEPGLFDYTKLAGCSLANIWFAGALGGLATWIVSAPSEFVKCRVQLQVERGGGGQGAGAGAGASSWAVARNTLKREGVQGLFRGGVITSVRDAVGYGWYFWSYELCKRLLVGRRSADWWAEMKAWEVLVAGGIAGVVTWASVYPLDVVKTRVQCWTPREGIGEAVGEREALLGRSVSKRPDIREVVREVWAEGGVRAFYRGIGVCSLRAFVVNAVQWYTYEKIMGLLKQPT